MIKYIKVKGSKATDIKIETYYNKGGLNYFTYKNETRGYYISVVPVKRRFNGRYYTESYTAFSGVKQLILEVKRQSAKQAEKADLLALDFEQDLINYVCEKNRLEVLKDEKI